LIEWSLEALVGASTIGPIVIAVPAGHEHEAERAAGQAAPGATVAVIAGGLTRAASVELALERVGGDVVAIHDAARPLITAALVDRVIERLESDPEADAAIAAAPISDTVKRAGASRREGGPAAATVAGTLDRDVLWTAQTPQAFRVAALRDAQRLATADGRLETATDEATLIEAAGGRVLLEAAGAANLKVTTTADLAAAEALIAARR
jgi:2-C-methyl-D-erythritol 4-phosphate cytidylyltransferase